MVKGSIGGLLQIGSALYKIGREREGVREREREGERERGRE